jgi:hypothetical protein
MLRQAILLAEVLHEKTLLLAAVLPRRRREAVDIMVINSTCVGRLAEGFLVYSFIVEEEAILLSLGRSASAKISAKRQQGKAQASTYYSYLLPIRSRANAPSTRLVPSKQHLMLLRLMPSLSSILLSHSKL